MKSAAYTLGNIAANWTVAGVLIANFLLAPAAAAQKNYDPGAGDDVIRIGNIAAYTGFGEKFGSVALAEAAYFRMINDRGGINGRKIEFISRDGGSGSVDPLSLARKLVEDDRVLLIFSPIGTRTNLAIRPYLNDRHVPQLFVESSAAAFDDPQHYPWTMGFFAPNRAEGAAYAKYVLRTKRGAKIGVLYSDDALGREYLAGARGALRDNASEMIVKEVAYESTGAAIDRQIEALKTSGADVFFNFAIGSFATAAIRAAYDMDWHPLQFIPNASISVAAFLEPAGLEKAYGIIANARSKGWLTPGSRDDPAVREFLDWMSKYNPQASLRDQNYVAGYERAQALVEVLRRCGDDLTRANVMRMASNLDVQLGMLRPGIGIKTSPSNYQPVKAFYLVRFDGNDWAPLGPVIDEDRSAQFGNGGERKGEAIAGGGF